MTVAALAAHDGIRPFTVSPVGHPTLPFDTPSGKLEFVADRATRHGLPALAVYQHASNRAGLVLRNDRTATTSTASTTTAVRYRRSPTPSRRHCCGSRRRSLPRVASPTAVGYASTTSVAQAARGYVTDRIPPGVVWIRSGFEETNRLTAAAACLPDARVDRLDAFAGQAGYGVSVEIEPA